MSVIKVGEPLVREGVLELGSLRIACAASAPADGEWDAVDGDTTAETAWGAGIALAKHLLLPPPLRAAAPAAPPIATVARGSSVVELGAGTGVAGLAAGAAGLAGSLVLTDLAQNVPRLTRALADNAAALGATQATAASLAWGGAGDATDAAVRALCSSSSGISDGGFDIILAADCTYCHTLHDILASTAVALARVRCRVRRAAAQRAGQQPVPPPTRILVAEEERWSDITAWWAESAAAAGLRLVAEAPLPPLPRVPRRIMLREYTLQEEADDDAGEQAEVGWGECSKEAA